MNNTARSSPVRLAAWAWKPAVSPRHGQHHHVGDGHRTGGRRGADVVAELAGAGGKLVGVPGQADDHVVTGP
jgi:hypothetical protein